MPDVIELQEFLEKLNPAQFNKVVFLLNAKKLIDKSNLSYPVAPTTSAIEVIDLLQQSSDGLRQLEEILRDKYNYAPPIEVELKQALESLKQALESEDLEKADQITTEILLKEAFKGTDSKQRLEYLLKLAKSQPENIELSEEEIKQISCPVLIQLNQLWEDNSKGLLGFRKQNDIWNSINRKDTNHWYEFASRVGWKINVEWASRKNNFFIKKEGHLPSFIYVSEGRINWDLFFKRIQNCEL
jgi:hypothetical protein